MNHVEITVDGKAQKMGNNFHAIRYVLAALVLYSHAYGLLALPEPGVFQFSFGSFAVKCFFALSGYLITLSCVRSTHLWHYILNRVLRIAPALIIALLLSHWVGSFFGNFIQNPTPYILNGPVWTLSWEIVCYGLCGLLWWSGLLTKNSMGPIVAISWLIFIFLPQTGDTIAVIAPLILLFFTGSLLALDEKQFSIRIAGPLFLMLLIGMSIDTNTIGLTWFFNQIPFLYGPNLPSHKYYLFAFVFGLPFALIWLALYVKPIINLRNDYSYGLYIYGWPVQQAIIALFTPSPLLLFVSSLAVTHCLSMFSWHLVESGRSCLSVEFTVNIA